MEPYLAEIRLFAGNFAPRNWALCHGQLLPIAQNQALFSLLGTTYGGDGRTTFALPDLRGRAPISPGQGAGLSADYRAGDKGGTETVTMTTGSMPSHHHPASGTLLAATGDGNTSLADGNSLAHDTNGNAVPDIYNSETSPAIPMKEGTVTVNIQNAGGQQAINNMQPYTVLHYIICIQGLYPTSS